MKYARKTLGAGLALTLLFGPFFVTGFSSGWLEAIVHLAMAVVAAGCLTGLVFVAGWLYWGGDK